jgi:hypothetical protein
MLDRETGEVSEHTLTHEGETVRAFYRALPAPVVVGIEATGSMGWFLQLMEEVGIACRVGHPATIRTAEPRRQKHNRRDANLLLRLLAEDHFPAIGDLDAVTTENPVRTDLIDDSGDQGRCARRPCLPKRREVWDANAIAMTRRPPLDVNGCGMVGQAGFEPAISRSRTGRDTRLRYFPRLTLGMSQ